MKEDLCEWLAANGMLSEYRVGYEDVEWLGGDPHRETDGVCRQVADPE